MSCIKIHINVFFQNFDQLSTDPAELMEILTYHVVPKELNTCKMFNDDQLDTLNGKKLRFNEYTMVSFSFSDVECCLH